MVGKFFKSLFRGIAKLGAYLFVTLGLWLPALYSLLYLIVVGISSKLTLQGAVLAVFFAGLGISVVGGLALAMRRSRKKAPAAVPPPAEEKPDARKRSGKRPPMPSPEPVQPSPPPAYDYSEQMRTMYADAYAAGYADARAQAQASRADRSDLDRKYFPQGTPSASAPAYETSASAYDAPVQTPPVSSVPPSVSADTGADMLWRRLTGEEVPDEQPLLYRTRRDPYLFVREYSDRYQFWRQTAFGMVLERTEFKQPSRDVSPRR